MENCQMYIFGWYDPYIVILKHLKLSKTTKDLLNIYNIDIV